MEDLEAGTQSYTTDLEQHKPAKSVQCKRIVKFLASCPHESVYKPVLKTAPDSVIKTICNAAYNVAHGDVHLTPAQKKLFAKHRKEIACLTSTKCSLQRKRKLLVNQKGGLFWLAPLIGTAISALGSALFNRG